MVNLLSNNLVSSQFCAHVHVHTCLLPEVILKEESELALCKLHMLQLNNFIASICLLIIYIVLDWQKRYSRDFLSCDNILSCFNVWKEAHFLTGWTLYMLFIVLYNILFIYIIMFSLLRNKLFFKLLEQYNVHHSDSALSYTTVQCTIYIIHTINVIQTYFNGRGMKHHGFYT